MRAYQDKITGLWKWGSNGKPIYQTKRQAQDYGVTALTEALMRIKRKLNKSIMDHGK